MPKYKAWKEIIKLNYYIINGTPIWVWGVLVLLVWYGLRMTKTRSAPVIAVYLSPFVGLISVNAVKGLPAWPMTWQIFGIAYLIGTSVGYLLQKRWIISKEGWKVSLAGEWFTLMVLMVIFGMNFAGGVSKAAFPDIYGGTLFLCIFTVCAGLASGSFFGRAFRVWRP